MCLWSVTAVMSDSLWQYGLYPSRYLYPWNSPVKNNRVVCHALFQRVSFQPMDQTRVSCVSCIASGFLTHWTTREAWSDYIVDSKEAQFALEISGSECRMLQKNGFCDLCFWSPSFQRKTPVTPESLVAERYTGRKSPELNANVLTSLSTDIFVLWTNLKGITMKYFTLAALQTCEGLCMRWVETSLQVRSLKCCV